MMDDRIFYGMKMPLLDISYTSELAQINGNVFAFFTSIGLSAVWMTELVFLCFRRIFHRF